MSTETFERCNQILKHIMGDTSVPRNIRRAAEESKNLLSQDDFICLINLKPWMPKL